MSTIGPSYALLVYQIFTQKGITEAQLFESTHLSRQQLEAGDNIPMEDFLQLLNNADAESPSHHVGLLLGQRSNILVLGSAGMSAAIAPSLRQGLQLLDSYSRVHVSYMGISVRSNLHGLSIDLDFSEDVGNTQRFHIETACMIFQNYIETILGTSVEDAHYFIPYDEPDYGAEFAALLHSPITYGHNQGAIQVPRRVLDIASPFYDRAAWQESQRFLANLIRKLTAQESKQQSYTQHVYALLQAHEPPLPTLHRIANQLHLSDRTLNRRLQEEGSNFREIKAVITHNWAKQYLRESELSVDAIALTLGYQDTANFRRAFRTRENCSPTHYREHQLDQ